MDHRNHNTLDHRRVNLRVTDVAGNAQNRRKQTGMSSIYIGVTKCGKSWRANISKNNIHYYLGSFETEPEAAQAYNARAIELYDGPILNVLPDLLD